MNILIVSATTFEIAPLFKQIGLNISEEKHFYSFSIKNHLVDIVITGVGMTVTAYYTTKYIRLKKYDLAVNIGICGSFNKNLDQGAVVNVYKDCISELGAEDDEQFLTLKQLNLPGKVDFENLNTFNNKIIDELPKVNGITVNTTHGNKNSIDKVFELFHPLIESMEGAAFMMVCYEEKINHIQIRAVSNYVEKRNKNNWNIPLAINNLNIKLSQILDTL